jgi:hypothetical protein
MGNAKKQSEDGKEGFHGEVLAQIRSLFSLLVGKVAIAFVLFLKRTLSEDIQT